MEELRKARVLKCVIDDMLDMAIDTWSWEIASTLQNRAQELERENAELLRLVAR